MVKRLLEIIYPEPDVPAGHRVNPSGAAMSPAHIPTVVLIPKSTVADLVQLCADGKLPFSGPDSLCSKVSAMGFKTTSLYEMVCAAERSKP